MGIGGGTAKGIRGAVALCALSFRLAQPYRDAGN